MTYKLKTQALLTTENSEIVSGFAVNYATSGTTHTVLANTVNVIKLEKQPAFAFGYLVSVMCNAPAVLNIMLADTANSVDSTLYANRVNITRKLSAGMNTIYVPAVLNADQFTLHSYDEMILIGLSLLTYATLGVAREHNNFASLRILNSNNTSANYALNGTQLPADFCSVELTEKLNTDSYCVVQLSGKNYTLYRTPFEYDCAGTVFLCGNASDFLHGFNTHSDSILVANIKVYQEVNTLTRVQNNAGKIPVMYI